MATQSAVFTFALPEDEQSDQLLILESTTKGGTYSTVDTVAYSYGISEHEYDSLDDTKWYKIQFNNSTDSETGPVSDPVYGGTFSNASPFLAVSTGTDGANYATTQDVYDYSPLTTENVSQARVSQALRRARAVIDLHTAALNLNRFRRSFNTETSRKKHNASLRVVREAEINIALGNVYRGLSDELIMKRIREELSGEGGTNSDSVTIGSTNLSGSVDNPLYANQLAALGNRYLIVGSSLLASLQPPSIKLHAKEDDTTQSPKFVYPFNGVS